MSKVFVATGSYYQYRGRSVRVISQSGNTAVVSSLGREFTVSVHELTEHKRKY